MDTEKFEVVCAQGHNDCVAKKTNTTANSGDVVLNDSKLKGGRFIIDNISVKLQDMSDPAIYAQFSGHLASDNFTFTEKYPEAFLDITSVTGNYVEGDLSIKGIMHPIDFDVVVNVDGDILTITAKLVFDHTKIRYEIQSG